MDAEYGKLAARIAAAYPGAFISDLTLVDWTERLWEADDIEHATRMAQRLRNLSGVPDPKDWQIAKRDTREIDYVRYELPAGPPEEMTEEQRERWEALKAMLREKPPFRTIPAALLAIPDADLEPQSRRRPSCPGEEDGRVNIVDGHMLCRTCGDDQCADCVPYRQGRKCPALTQLATASPPLSDSREV